MAGDWVGRVKSSGDAGARDGLIGREGEQRRGDVDVGVGLLLASG